VFVNGAKRRPASGLHRGLPQPGADAPVDRVHFTRRVRTDESGRVVNLSTKPDQAHYFEEQLQRIREIRLSERRFYQKITDISSGGAGGSGAGTNARYDSPGLGT
jgi:hypothetical protein